MEELYNSPDDITSLRNAIAGVCEYYKVPDPARWLAVLMTGQDPRPMEAPILDMVRREFDEEGGTPFPDHGEWGAIVDHVLSSGLYENARVPLQDSLKAAQKLMDFLHKHQKQVTAEVQDISRTEPSDITDADVIRVRKIFNDVF